METEKLQEKAFKQISKHPLVHFRLGNFPACLLAIVALFMEDANYGHIIECYLNGNRLFLSCSNGRREHNHLMLRFPEPGYIVVADVVFLHQRQGYMTRLYELLKSLGKVSLENVYSEEMIAWAVKNGFIEKLEFMEMACQPSCWFEYSWYKELQPVLSRKKHVLEWLEQSKRYQEKWEVSHEEMSKRTST